MQWVRNIQEVETTLRRATEFAAMDKGPASTRLERLTFDSVEFHSRRFLTFLRNLIGWGCDISCHYVVLDPDPINYYFFHFHKYPVIEIEIGDSEDAYIAALTEDPGGSPADAIGTNWYEYVILPPSDKWYIHATRDARSGEGGHLWVPKEWRDKVKEVYPYAVH